MTKRKFYKTEVKVTVISEEPLAFGELSDLSSQITEGDCSGRIRTGKSVKLSGKQCAKALLSQGSDPEFFCLTKDGKDAEE